MEKESFVLRKFDGGWNTEDASDELQVNESPDLQNVEFTNTSVRKAYGTTELGSDSDDEQISCLVKASSRNAGDYLFKFSGTKMKIYDSNNSVWSVIKTGLTEGLRWGYDVFNNILIVVSTVDDAMEIDIGKITRLNGAVSAGDATITLNDASQFDSSGTVMINGAAVSYTGKSGNDLTGCSGAVDTPDDYLVVQAPVAKSSIPKGNMCINFGGRLIIAGVTGSGGATLYGSKASDRTDFTITGGGASDDAFAEALVSKINAIRTFYDDDNNQRIMAFLDNNTIYAINVEDDASLGTLVTQHFFKESVTAINHFSTIVGQNDIYHIDKWNQVRTLGPRKTGSGSKNFSDLISQAHKTLFRDSYNFSDSAGVVSNNEFWLLCKVNNNNYNDTIIVFDQVKAAWRKRTGIYASDIVEYDGKITIAGATENKVWYIDPKSTDDNNNAIHFKYSTFDIDLNPLRFERLRALRISGIISENATLTVKLYRDFGSVLLASFEIKGNNENIIGSVAGISGAFGNVAFGEEEFGGEDYSDRRFFIAHLDLPQLPDLENFRVELENNEAGVYVEISKIKPLPFVQAEDYFPKKYILTNS